ncbi:MAG TPA: dihydrolipoamide acetyltransferase family protein [Streptosporangiaceae bacterium]|nr:dihydrolipoamide acetyltransferase family protein [Streptosporangiaceae bacterium]
MSELKQFKLPDVGEGLTEADIVRWLVQPGDKISINQIIVEIETAKAVVELPSPYEGVVEDLLVPEGTTADVGMPIISVQVGAAGSAGAADAAGSDGAAGPGGGRAAAGGNGEAGPADAAAVPTGVPAPPADISEPPAEGAVEPGIYGSPAPKEKRQAVLVGYGVKLGATKRRARKPVTTDADAPASAGQAAPDAGARAPAANGGRAAVLAKPPVRKLAKELGVDLARLSGTGPSGSITRDDIQAAAAAVTPAEAVGAEAAPAGAEPGGLAQVAAMRLASLPREERIAIRGVRKHTAAAMAASAFTAPHVTEFLQIDITETITAAARLKSLAEFEGIRVSPLVLVAKALLVAASRQPMINSSWDEAAQEIVVKHYVNLGIAAATDRGLMVPSVKDAHALSLPGLAQAISDLASTARAGKATPADLRGGTITITNVGVFGVDTGTPIITPGEAAILAFGQVRDAPWVVDGQLAVRKVCTLALSFDHRIVDGDTGSAVLRDVGAMLTDPLRMLAWS